MRAALILCGLFWTVVMVGLTACAMPSAVCEQPIDLWFTGKTVNVNVTCGPDGGYVTVGQPLR